ncbi:MAG TPA: DUF1003 domain-containing protein [Candidatus Limnocylindria bacterium]|nr:DUF1003 domain-containing protein [Candidatus Limnocylindria bacterium]
MLENLPPILNPHSSHEENIDNRRRAITSYKAKADAKRTATEKFADWMTIKFGTILFLGVNAIWFFAWIVINKGWIPGIKPFDPFPFGLLTMIVSLEAIFLAIIVLISQNREARIGEVREEIELQISTIAEGEVTKIIKLLSIMLEKQGVDIEKDPELQKMLKPINSVEIEHKLEKELN